LTRIAIFGGSFDPVHRGHLEIIRAIDKQVRPDRFLLIPCGTPPHRDSLVANSEQRLCMLELACRELRESGIKIEIDRREIDREGPSYSYLTLEQLRRENPEALLLLAMGWDSLVGFATWRCWQKILEISCISVVSRAGDKRVIPAEIGVETESLADTELAAGKIIQLEFDEIALSSTEVRRLLKDRRIEEIPLKDAPLSPGVYEYIQQQRIYLG
jgi:nicotinate-nucleotide adenylyltransferase